MRLTVVGLFFCLAGLLCIVQIIIALWHNSISFNFGVCMLPVGVGLLHGKASSRRWAKFWIVLGYMVGGALIVLPPLFPSHSHVDLFDYHVEGLVAWPYIAGGALLGVGVLYLMHRLLYSEVVTDYLERQSRITASVDAEGG